MISGFVFSAEGLSFLKEFKEKFESIFRIDEPGGSDVVMDTDDYSYRIPDNGSLEEFKAAVDLSVKTGENHVAKLYSNNRIEYDEETLY